MLWCKYRYDGPSEKAAGFHRYACQRRGCNQPAHSPYAIERNFGICQGFPDDDEVNEWVGYFERTFSLTMQDAICWFVRWRADGSEIADLPPPFIVGDGKPIQPAPPTNGGLSDDELSELRLTDPTLLGNRLEAMFKQIGIPPCEACGKRRDWINNAHQWLRDTCAVHRSDS